jgi:hypothetical protein
MARHLDERAKHEDMALAGVVHAVNWRHISDKQPNILSRIDRRCFVHPAKLRELSLRPLLVSENDDPEPSQDRYVWSHRPAWKQHAQFGALAGDGLIPDSGLEIIDKDAEQEEHGDKIIEWLFPQAQAIERQEAWIQDRGRRINRSCRQCLND